MLVLVAISLLGNGAAWACHLHLESTPSNTSDTAELVITHDDAEHLPDSRTALECDLCAVCHLNAFAVTRLDVSGPFLLIVRSYPWGSAIIADPPHFRFDKPPR